MAMITGTNIQIVEGDLSNSEHADSFLRLTAAYMSDVMGGADTWTDEQRTKVVKDMKSQNCALVLLAKVDDQYVGICTCFFAYSTFLAKPLLNIHDIYVDVPFRGNGVGKRLIKAVEDTAEKMNCGKITLEVRKDNLNARDLYKSKGFKEAARSMFFWTKKI